LIAVRPSADNRLSGFISTLPHSRGKSANDDTGGGWGDGDGGGGGLGGATILALSSLRIVAGSI